VEVDQQQVNLTRFNLFFPEKRDFFLENSGIFSFGPGNERYNASNLIPFFSRRIGLSAAGTPIPIVGGARVSGTVDRFDVGVLSMKTERLGDAPSSNYLVGRVKRNLLRTSWIGAIVTDRESAVPNDYNRVYGPDLHFQFFDRLDIDSYLLQSDTPGKSGSNHARTFVAAWRDDELYAAMEHNAVGANFNPEVGFVRRGNMAQYSGDFAWRPLLRRSETIRNVNLGTSVDYFNGGNGKLETRSQDVNLGIQFENSGSINFNLTDTFDRLVKPFAIRPAISIPGELQHPLQHHAPSAERSGSRVQRSARYDERPARRARVHRQEDESLQLLSQRRAAKAPTRTVHPSRFAATNGVER
jgi:hypothetical protein